MPKTIAKHNTETGYDAEDIAELRVIKRRLEAKVSCGQKALFALLKQDQDLARKIIETRHILMVDECDYDEVYRLLAFLEREQQIES